MRNMGSFDRCNSYALSKISILSILIVIWLIRLEKTVTLRPAFLTNDHELIARRFIIGRQLPGTVEVTEV